VILVQSCFVLASYLKGVLRVKCFMCILEGFCPSVILSDMSHVHSKF